MKRLSTTIVFSALTVFAAACQQDPFPKNGKITEKQLEPTPVAPPYSIEAPVSMSCVEGAACEAIIRGHVPAGGTPILTLDGLPAGAVYDEKKGVLTYTPGFDVVDVAKNPTETSTELPFNISLRSSSDPKSGSTKTVRIFVKNVMRPVTLTLSTSKVEMKEGETFKQSVTVASPDFPKGPFQLSLVGAPASVAVTSAGAVFKLEYTPPHDFVTYKDTRVGDTFVKTLPVQYTVGLPVGMGSTTSVDWKIIDDRLLPSVSAPVEITQGPDVNFMVRADDLNGEGAPIITFPTNLSSGTITAAEVGLTAPKPGISIASRLYEVRWEGIDPVDFGKDFPIVFVACGPTAQGEYTLCTTGKTMVHLRPGATPPPAPILAHGPGTSGNVGYARVGIDGSFGLNVAAGNTVSIFPESMRSQVRWSANRLYVSPKATGRLAFQVQAASAGNVQRESFVVDALPNSWSDVVRYSDEGLTAHDLVMRKTVLVPSESARAETQGVLEAMGEAGLATPRIQLLKEGTN